MQIILFIFILFVAVIFIIMSMFRKIISFFLGGSIGRTGNQSQRTSNEYSANSDKEDSKVFSKEEGEYVKFEEIE